MVKISDINAIPVMTSNTTPSGIASASSVTSGTGYEAWRAFDRNTGSYWCSEHRGTLVSAQLEYEFPQKKRIAMYSIIMNGSLTYAPSDWTFEGYDEIKDTWDVLDTITGQSFTLNVKKTYSFNNAKFYKKYRMNMTKNNGGNYFGIYEMEMFAVLPEKRLTLKNPTTDKHYSLSDNTLIHLPSTSDKNMISYGIEQGKEIQLDIPFDKVQYVQDTSEILGNGKKFQQQSISTENIKKITVEDNY